ncbi:MAG: LruC domain-containing protein [Myxococcales bacterium]|nr:LruC domain-containing protein [Myxococcales bacterium]
MTRRSLALIIPLALASWSAAAVSPSGEYQAVPANVTSAIGRILPESSAVGQSFLSTAYSPNAKVTAPATIRVTFVHEGAGYRNSLGWFTYDETGSAIRIRERGLIFPNASFADPNLGWGGGDLVTGDAMTLRTSNGQIKVFAPGDNVGFFLVANGWNGSSVRGWSATPPTPSELPATNAAGQGTYTTVDGINPEVAAGRPDLARHVAMLKLTGVGDAPVYLVGFEDLRRTSGADNDFNDLVFIVDANPLEAIAETQVINYVANVNDPDGDGVEGLQDHFPNDPLRAFVQVTPTTGVQTLVFEDNYPLVGDMDYNDVVVQYSFEEALSAEGTIRDVVATFHLIARGAGLDHSFGFRVPLENPALQGTVTVERFRSDGSHPAVDVAQLSSLITSEPSGTWLTLPQVFASTKTDLAAPDSPYTNTETPTFEVAPASARVKVTFSSPVARSVLGLPPYDPFILIKHGTETYDVHLAGRNAFHVRPSGLPTETGVSAFMDDAGHPFAMIVPWDFRFPLEAVPISRAFPEFSTWRASQGTKAKTWYATPATGSSPAVSGPVSVQVRSRPWSIGLSSP